MVQNHCILSYAKVVYQIFLGYLLKFNFMEHMYDTKRTLKNFLNKG